MSLLDFLCLENCRHCHKMVVPHGSAATAFCSECWSECAPHPRVNFLELNCTPQDLRHAVAINKLEVDVQNVRVASGCRYNAPIKSAMYKLKYDDDRLVIQDLSKLLLHALKTAGIADTTDGGVVLVPIPLHWWRQFRRGFNQSELLAKSAAKPLRLPVKNILRRTRSTKAHHDLGKEQRRSNISGAFGIAGSTKGILHAVIVDDIFTTGATIAEAARVLLGAGIPRVSAITVARAEMRNEQQS